MGKLLLLSDGEALTGLYMDRDIPVCAQARGCDALDRTKRWLDAYFRGDRPAMDIPLAAEGTPFQKMVWARLQEIPYGTVVSYGQIAAELAEKLGKKNMSAQAVGQAVGRNPISILIPCHRVVGAKGQLTGYAGGLEKKVWFLRHEEVIK